VRGKEAIFATKGATDAYHHRVGDRCIALSGVYCQLGNRNDSLHNQANTLATVGKSIDAFELMKSSKNLPHQQWDAF